MTLRAQAERAAEELASASERSWAARETKALYPDSSGTFPLKVSAAIDTDPQREALSLPWHRRLRVTLSKLWSW